MSAGVYEAMALAAATPYQCGHCGTVHIGACPRIKAIEYHPNGTVARVEYHSPAPSLSADTEET